MNDDLMAQQVANVLITAKLAEPEHKANAEMQANGENAKSRLIDVINGIKAKLGAIPWLKLLPLLIQFLPLIIGTGPIATIIEQILAALTNPPVPPPVPAA